MIGIRTKQNFLIGRERCGALNEKFPSLSSFVSKSSGEWDVV
jgi:hypothetical protein